MRPIDADKFELVKEDLRSHLDEGFIDGARYILDMIDEAPTVNQWISVKDRLPKKKGRYLCYRHLRYTKFLNISPIGVYYYGRMENEGDRKGFYFFDSEYGDVEVSNVTHWMELPEPPEGE